MIIRMTSRNRISGEAAAAGKWCRKSDSKTTAQAEREPPGRASVYVS